MQQRHLVTQWTSNSRTSLHFWETSPHIFFIINLPEAPLQLLRSFTLSAAAHLFGFFFLLLLFFMVFVPRRDWLVPGSLGTFHDDEGLRKVFGKTIFYLFDVFMVIVPVRYQLAAAALRNVLRDLIKRSRAAEGRCARRRTR